MRSPSVKVLMTFKDIGEAKAKLIKEIAKAHGSKWEVLARVIEENCPKTQAYVERCRGINDYTTDFWLTTFSLHAIDEVFGTYGVEAFGPTMSHAPYSPHYEYLNTGDIYNSTLVYRLKTNNLYVGCPGDIIGRHPQWGNT